MHCNSTLLSRLAIALLAICGFTVVLPVERQVDEAAQVEVVGARVEVAAAEAEVVRVEAPELRQVHVAHVATSCRYLLNRAWLI